MRIICAPDSFKESLSAAEAASAMQRGIQRAAPQAQVDLCPVADGGEGTVDTIVAATGGDRRVDTVPGPLYEPFVDAAWGLLAAQEGRPAAAVIEMAAASGLERIVAEQRNPLFTTTAGTGRLIRCALDAGARSLVLGIGGSATNDGGCGMAEELGVRFLDRQGRSMNTAGAGFTGQMLSRIGSIDVAQIDPRVAQSPMTVACDVTNPMTGEQGAAAIYGPQKGATPAQVQELDDGLAHLAELFRRDLNCDVQYQPGAGAAGGLGGGVVAFLGAQLQPGIELVLATVAFERRVSGCDLCLTGEGRLDGQSLSGKACVGVAQVARRCGVDTIALVGSVGQQVQRTLTAGLHAFHVIGEGLSLEDSMCRAGELLESAAARVVTQRMGSS